MSNETELVNPLSTIGIDSETVETRSGRIPGTIPVFSATHWVGYGVFLAITFAAMVIAIFWYSGWIDRYQRARPRYASERAQAALAQKNLELAKAEVDMLLKERPFFIRGLFDVQFSEVYEGPVLRNRVQSYLNLTSSLMDAGLLAEAEAVAWKSLLEFHMLSRSVELIQPWEMLFYIKMLRAAQGDPSAASAAIEISRILAAHGVDKIRKPGEMVPFNYTTRDAAFAAIAAEPVNPIQRGMKALFEATEREEFENAAKLLREAYSQTPSEPIRRQLDPELHRALSSAGRRPDARQHLQQVWGRDPRFMDSYWLKMRQRTAPLNLLDRDPTLMRMMWLDRPLSSRVGLFEFMDSFGKDARVKLLDLKQLTLRQEGYYPEKNNFEYNFGRVAFFQGAVAGLDFETREPVKRIFLAYEATKVLGISPILLVRLDDQPYVPLYCDSEKPDLLGFDCDLPPGRHALQLVYLNDSGFDYPARQIQEDRNLMIDRIALVHVNPPK